MNNNNNNPNIKSTLVSTVSPPPSAAQAPVPASLAAPFNVNWKDILILHQAGAGCNLVTPHV